MGKQLGERHTAFNNLAYALPLLGVSFLIGPINILQGIYAKNFGLSLTVIAAVVFIARLFDAISDPVIGYISDRHYQRTGSRKIFIITGGLLFIVCSYFLFVPLGSDDSNVSPVYFLTCYIGFYFSWTLFEIPHLAWGSEISSSSEQRNKLFSLRALLMYIGTALFFCLPLLPFFESTEFSPSTLFWSVVLGGVLVVPLLYLCIKNVPNSLVESASSNLNCNVRKPKIKDVWHIIWGNQPFLVFLSAFFLAGVGAGMSLGILFIFVDVYLGLGHKLSLAYLLSYGVSILAVGLWYKLANSLGKNVSWGVGMLLVVLGHLGMGFISPGESGWLPLLVCMIFIYGGMTSSVTLAPSILSDIIDFGIWKFGQDYAATYFSVYTLVLKANVGIGTALGLAVAGVYGFVPSIGIQTERAIFGLQLSIAWLPALIATVSIAFIALTPINQRRHKIIRRRVALKLDRAKSKYLREGDPQNKGVGPSSNLNAI